MGPFPIARAQKKFLLVAVDYFSKWVEAEPLAKITEEEVMKFLWKNIVCRFDIPRRLIPDNARKDWVEELPSILWAYRTTPQTAGSEAVLPVEIGQSSTRIESYPSNNDQTRAIELDLVEEKRDRAAIRMEAYQSRVMKSYNKHVRARYFQVGGLVMKKVKPVGDVGKIEARWEGPLKVIQRVSSGAAYI
ncbi:uncharacterized protein LOC142506055 [Primulina tabacum]|uniref:uncharacterized protein LOC142506055 n=1 Tax=Primulina tabacum TaxID=48773 RepID=UPI003F59AE88